MDKKSFLSKTKEYGVDPLSQSWGNLSRRLVYISGGQSAFIT